MVSQLILLLVLVAPLTVNGVDITIRSSLSDGFTELYTDGIKVGEGRGEYSQELRPGVAVIAADSRNGAAILIKTSDGFTTDASWRCTTRTLDYWTSLFFDQDSMPPAKVLTNLTVPMHMQPAKWITAPEPGSRVSCRGRYYGDIPSTRLLAHAMHSNIEIRYDFWLQHRGDGVWGIPLPAHVSLITLNAATPVFMATTDGFVSGTSHWRCSPTWAYRWNEPEFDDSNWLPAVVSNAPLPPFTGCTNAVWMTAQGSNGPVYCRGDYAGFLASGPPRPHTPARCGNYGKTQRKRKRVW